MVHDVELLLHYDISGGEWIKGRWRKAEIELLLSNISHYCQVSWLLWPVAMVTDKHVTNAEARHIPCTRVYTKKTE